jgi:hypothetical protein
VYQGPQFSWHAGIQPGNTEANSLGTTLVENYVCRPCYKWVPNQKINEWLCIPSEQEKYLQEQGVPAGSFPDEPPQRYGGGRPQAQ